LIDTELLVTGDAGARWTLILAHGAGVGMRSPFMASVAEGVAKAGAACGGIRVVRFDFPYMAARSVDGRKRPPDRQPKLLALFREVITLVLDAGAVREQLIIGGKSMGGRMASLLAEEERVAGLICLGYPFHPPGSPDHLRTEHLRMLAVPTLICQGERDAFGGRGEVDGFGLAEAIQLCWLPDGDHGFKPRKKSGHTEEANLQRAIKAIVAFVGALGSGTTRNPS